MGSLVLRHQEETFFGTTGTDGPWVALEYVNVFDTPLVAYFTHRLHRRKRWK